MGRKGTRSGEFHDLKVINNTLYVCDRGNNRVQILNTELEFVNHFGCHGDEHNDIAQGGAGNLYVNGNNCVQVFEFKGHFLYSFSIKGAASKQLDYPCGICIGSDQLVYISDSGNQRVTIRTTLC